MCFIHGKPYGAQFLRGRLGLPLLLAAPSLLEAQPCTCPTPTQVLVAFILPGCLSLKTERRRPLYRALAWCCVVIGLSMGVVGVLNTLVLRK